MPENKSSLERAGVRLTQEDFDALKKNNEAVAEVLNMIGSKADTVVALKTFGYDVSYKDLK